MSEFKDQQLHVYDYFIYIGIGITLFFIPTGCVPRYLGQLLLLIGWIWKCIANKSFYVGRSKYDLMWLILFVWYTITGFVGFVSWYQLGVGVSKPLEWLFAYYTIITHIKTRKQVRKLLYVIFISATITAGFSIYQHFFLHFDRTISFFSNPNIFADYEEVIISLLFAYLLFDVHLVDFTKRAAVFVFNVVGWFYSLSIGSWLGVGVGLLFGVMLKPRRKIFVLFLLVVVGVSLVASPSMNKRFHTFLNALKGEINPIDMERVYAWQSIMKMLRDRPIFGVGVENFDIAYPQYKMPKAHLYMLEAHNLYLHLAACTGWIGLAIFLVLWISIFRDGIRLYFSTGDEEYKRFILGVLVMWVVINVHGLVTYSFYDRQVSTLIWSLFGLMEVVRKLSNVSNGEKDYTSRAS